MGQKQLRRNLKKTEEWRETVRIDPKHGVQTTYSRVFWQCESKDASERRNQRSNGGEYSSSGLTVIIHEFGYNKLPLLPKEASVLLPMAHEFSDRLGSLPQSAQAAVTVTVKALFLPWEIHLLH